MMSLFRDRLKARGTRGITKLQNIFKMMDDDGSGSLNLFEFTKACREFKVGISEEYLPTLFNAFDLNNDSTLSVQEFLIAVRGDMNERRMQAVQNAWAKIAPQGVLDMLELKDLFKAEKHPDVARGKRMAREVLNEFLETFEMSMNIMQTSQDGSVTFDEFLEFHRNVSFIFDDDTHFVLVMNSVWGVNAQQDPYARFNPQQQQSRP